ncbi:MAG: tRNA (N(6)-L-threonylcarbamoyladenosine(37)-C(2))-methylthiotransferase MtaB [Lachnospiraceae bacterium]|nr:tRNA (N(6)-L-threonylcarbamoyladenosine(37)-C(2))-methylthiotransferase MtaB [Lachnospiraceae bacterium]
MKTVAFHNLGCKVNTYEIEMMQQNARKAGWEIVEFTQKADAYVINTCSVTNIADRKSRQMLHKAKKTNPEAIVVAVGCYAQTDTKGALSDEAVDLVIGNNHKEKLIDIINEYEKSHEKKAVVDDISSPIKYEDYSIDGSSERTRVDIKIQDGCDQFCTFCIIPFARGRIRSRDQKDVIDEIKRLADAGYKEIVLTGIHLSSYGLDLHDKITSYNLVANEDYTNFDLIDVIKKVSDIDGIKRIRLGSLEPRVITRQFLESISAIDKVCPHFHLSLQSGCDETLKRMNRRYTANEYAAGVKLIREYYEHPAITTDIIVGFPGETEEEFQKTISFVESIDFYETHIFKYSRRHGTVADTMPGQLTEKVKAQRSDELEKINKIHMKRFMSAVVGKKEEILTEEQTKIDNRTYTLGHTKNYIMMAVEGAYEKNLIIEGTVTGFLQNDIMLLKR